MGAQQSGQQTKWSSDPNEHGKPIFVQGKKSSSSDSSSSSSSSQSSNANLSSPSDDALKSEYQRGRDESSKEIQSALSQVAAQVYDNVHSQLQSIQKKEFERSNTLSEEIKSKLQSVQTNRPKSCVNEENSLIQCLKDNKSNGNSSSNISGIACTEAIKALQKCSESIAVKK